MHSESENILLAKNQPLDMQEWRNLIKEWDSSKETQKEYCQRLRINLNTFSYARGKLNKKEKIKPKFIPLILNQNDSARISDQHLLTIENPRGFKLHISPSLSFDLLNKIFKLSGW